MKTNNNRIIGIMSMQRIANYGSFLQSYALKKKIESLGYSNVFFVDYEYEKSIVKSAKKKLYQKILNNLDIDYVKRKRHRAAFRKAYKSFLPELGVGSQINNMYSVDTLVIGSDEVFNCMQDYPIGYSRGLFGKGYEQSNVISYAASFGHTKLAELKKYHIDKEIGTMLSKFKKISVRDDNSKSIVEALVHNQKPIMHLDPVLIGDFGDAFDKKVKYKNYIIVYAYPGRLSPEEEKRIRRFARKHNKKIISLGFYQKCADYNIIVKPLEVLSFFKNADYVITDTFHGSVFSIKANTKFCTIIRESNRNKLIALLAKMHCERQIANCPDDIETIYNNTIDFSNCNAIIAEETKKTVKYLKECL